MPLFLLWESCPCCEAHDVGLSVLCGSTPSSPCQNPLYNYSQRRYCLNSSDIPRQERPQTLRTIPCYPPPRHCILTTTLESRHVLTIC